VRKDVVFQNDGTDDAKESKEILGLESLISDSAPFHGISRTTSPSTQSYESDGSGALLTTDLVQKAISQANKKGGGKIECAFMNHDTYNRFVEIAEEDRRINSTADGSMGFKKLGYDSAWGTVRFEIDEFCRKDRIYMIDPRYLELVGRDFDLLEVEGQSMRLAPSSSGGFEQALSAEMYGELEMLSTHPASMAKVQNFTLS
jgi:hypothetical protein